MDVAAEMAGKVLHDRAGNIDAGDGACAAAPVLLPQGDEDEEEDDELVTDTTDLGEFQCVCRYDFDDFEQLCGHRGLEHANNSFSCASKIRNAEGKEVLCALEFHTLWSMWGHYHAIHLGRYYYYCAVPNCKLGKDEAKYGADSKALVKKHMNDSHGIQSDIKCPKCKYVTGEKFRLHDHIEVCQVDKKIKLHKCNECPKSFWSRRGLVINKNQDHPVDPTDKSAWHHCGACEKTFKTISSRRKHRKNDHKDIEFS